MHRGQERPVEPQSGNIRRIPFRLAARYPTISLHSEICSKYSSIGRYQRHVILAGHAGRWLVSFRLCSRSSSRPHKCCLTARHGPRLPGPSPKQCRSSNIGEPPAQQQRHSPNAQRNPKPFLEYRVQPRYCSSRMDRPSGIPPLWGLDRLPQSHHTSDGGWRRPIRISRLDVAGEVVLRVMRRLHYTWSGLHSRQFSTHRHCRDCQGSPVEVLLYRRQLGWLGCDWRLFYCISYRNGTI